MPGSKVIPSGWSVFLFSSIGGLVALDVVLDARDGLEWSHAFVDILVVVVSALGALGYLRQWREERERAAATVRRWHGEADRWRARWREALAGLGAAIDEQFRRWGLTPAETEVGLLLLKGLSQREIAAARQTSERTVGQQARAIYRKAGLSGRAELSAFFLEDLLLPGSIGAENGGLTPPLDI